MRLWSAIHFFMTLLFVRCCYLNCDFASVPNSVIQVHYSGVVAYIFGQDDLLLVELIAIICPGQGAGVGHHRASIKADVK